MEETTGVNYYKIYYAKNKEMITKRNKAYRDKNNEKIKEKYSKYWQDNKDSIKQKRKELIDCPLCNVQITRESFSRHKISKSHLSKINNENIEELKSNENV